MSDTATGPEYAVHELLAMDEATARETLTVAQYERYEQLQTLHDEADATRERWASEDQQVTDITVEADPEQLGTELDLFGNDVLVRVDPDDSDLRAQLERLDDLAPDAEDTDALDDATAEELAAGLQDALGRVLVRWNGHDWGDLGEDVRADVLATCRRKWGIDGLLAAWVEVGAAVAEDQQDRVDVIESFRSPERRGRR